MCELNVCFRIFMHNGNFFYCSEALDKNEHFFIHLETGPAMNHGNSIAISMKSIGRAHYMYIVHTQPEYCEIYCIRSTKMLQKVYDELFSLHFTWLSDTKWIARCAEATAGRKKLSKEFVDSSSLAFALFFSIGLQVCCLANSLCIVHTQCEDVTALPCCHACSTLRYLNFIERYGANQREKILNWTKSEGH